MSGWSDTLHMRPTAKDHVISRQCLHQNCRWQLTKVGLLAPAAFVGPECQPKETADGCVLGKGCVEVAATACATILQHHGHHKVVKAYAASMHFYITS